MLRAILSVVVLIVIAITVVIKFSSIERRYECKGVIGKIPITIYIKIEEYRWWVNLWSDSYGNLTLEIPNTAYEYYPHIVKVGDQRQRYEEPLKI